MHFSNPFKRHESDTPTAAISGQTHPDALVDANGIGAYALLNGERANRREVELQEAKTGKELGEVATAAQTDVVVTTANGEPVDLPAELEKASVEEQLPVDSNQQKAA